MKFQGLHRCAYCSWQNGCVHFECIVVVLQYRVHGLCFSNLGGGCVMHLDLNECLFYLFSIPDLQFVVLLLFIIFSLFCRAVLTAKLAEWFNVWLRNLCAHIHVVSSVPFLYKHWQNLMLYLFCFCLLHGGLCQQPWMNCSSNYGLHLSPEVMFILRKWFSEEEHFKVVQGIEGSICVHYSKKKPKKSYIFPALETGPP